MNDSQLACSALSESLLEILQTTNWNRAEVAHRLGVDRWH